MLTTTVVSPLDPRLGAETRSLGNPRRSARFLRSLVLAVSALAQLLSGSACGPRGEAAPATAVPLPAATTDLTSTLEPGTRLRLVDLGADRCVPCRAMAPILEELRVEQAERLEVVFIDVWRDPAAGEPYGVRIIPTQIFYDGQGSELWRHQGFLSKRDVLGTWKALGYDLEAAAATSREAG
jgi:thioredoxin 1